MDEVDRLRRRLDRERRARRAAELIAEQSTRDALHDPLTGLANRSLLISRLTDALRRHGTGGEVVVAYVDLDRFKHINDTYGHEFGDGVLVEVAERLRHAVRETDTVGRIGGDEFVVVATALSPALTTALVARIAEAVDFTYAGKGPALPVNGSIGVAIPSGDADNAYDVLRDADNAMYHAKSDGRGVTVHAHSVQQAARRRLQLTSELRTAIEHDGLEVHGQPIVALSSGDLVSIEALCRWTSPTYGSVPPSEFIAVAERAGLIGRLGHAMLRGASRAVAAIHDPRPELWVNASPRELCAPDLTATVANVLNDTGLAPERLWFEVTESAFAASHEAIVDRIHQLRMLGVRVAIDDFGTGYSSLSRLRTMPIDGLKLDGSFVADVNDSQQGAAIVRALLELADAVELRCVAEGIEDAATVTRLRALGCRFGQGYHLARPSPIAAAVDPWRPSVLTRAATPSGGRGGT